MVTGACSPCLPMCRTSRRSLLDPSRAGRKSTVSASKLALASLMLRDRLLHTLQLMVTTRSRKSLLATSRQSEVPQPRANALSVAERDHASVTEQLDSARSDSGSAGREHLASELLQRDRPASAAKAIKKKVKAIKNQPSIPAKDLGKLQIKASKIYKQLLELFVDPPCPLDHQSSFQLLVSVILSAQTTDKKVNEVTPELFELAPDAQRMASLEVGRIEGIIRYVGLAPTKAKNLSKMSKALVSDHQGEVPQTFEELEQLAGVGHKTASVVMAVAFKLATFPVDTHIHRLAQRWGLTDGRSVEQTEVDLKLLWPEDQWNALHLRLIYCGRTYCPALGHNPADCPICSWAAVAPYDRAHTSPARAGHSQRATPAHRRKNVKRKRTAETD